MDDLVLELDAGETKVAQFRELTEPRCMALKFELYETEREPWKLFYSSYAAARPTSREIRIFNWNDKDERVTYKNTTFDDKRSVNP